MPVAATPTDRLNIYLQDFERAHDQVAPLFSSRRVKDRDAFTAWREALAQVDAANRCGGARTDANGFATPPLFALSSITITSVLEYGSAAVARMTRSAGLTAYIEAALSLVDGDWRLGAIREYLDDPDSLLTEPQQLEDRLASLSEFAPLADPEEDENPNLDAIFQDGWAREAVWEETLESDDDVDDSDPVAWAAFVARKQAEAPVRATRVLELGTFEHGEHLAFLDPGWPHETVITALPVPPGTARAQALEVDEDDDDRIAALRLLLGPAAADPTSAPVPVSWHEAMGDKGTHVVGVEAGTAALADAERLLTLDHRTWQRIEDTLLDSDAGLLADPGTGSAPVGAFSRSGWGDGGYGVYWGLAEDGAPLHLVIDFGLICAPAPAPEQ